MMKWEYKEKEMVAKETDGADVLRLLNDEWKDGWMSYKTEPVDGFDNHHLFYFKRPIPDPVPSLSGQGSGIISVPDSDLPTQFTTPPAKPGAGD